MDRGRVQAWLDRYVSAWETYDPTLIGALFSADAEYRYRPYDEGDAVIRGREAIVRAWVEAVPAGVASGRDEPGTFEAHYAPWAVEGERAVAAGWTRYWADRSRARETDTFHNVFLLVFDDDGRCRSFTEWFVARPRSDPPEPGGGAPG